MILHIVILQFTMISAFVYHRPPRVVDVYFALCVILLCITHTILVSIFTLNRFVFYWYQVIRLELKMKSFTFQNTYWRLFQLRRKVYINIYISPDQ